MDDDCSGVADEGVEQVDADGDGYSLADGDCSEFRFVLDDLMVSVPLPRHWSNHVNSSLLQVIALAHFATFEVGASTARSPAYGSPESVNV